MIKKMIVLLGLLCGFSMHAAELARMKARSEEKRASRVDYSQQNEDSWSTKQLTLMEDVYNPSMTEEQRKKKHLQGLYPHYNFQQIIHVFHQQGVAFDVLLKNAHAVKEIKTIEEAKKLAEKLEENYILDINNQLKQQEKTRIAQQNMSVSSCKDSE
ncbi:hypothetical protein KBD08_04470 [Candidatus Babeliales bacterium]|nr:hypothetical protein [Candidatus Babeliales bacterium]